MGGQNRQRGTIDRRPSGSLRVRVYAGIDPVTKKRHELIEHIPPGPKAEALAEAARVRLVNQVNERRHPRTTATVAQLLERYLGELRVARKTLHTYQGYVDKHVLPYLGSQKVGQVDADILDSLYAELLRCRDHCDGKPGHIDHRVRGPHKCDSRCTAHKCRPLAAWTVRKIHWILSGAFRRAQRWNWVATNPMTMAEPPAIKPPNPKPPTAQEAAQIIQEAWKDPDWGTLIWLTMVTGQRRGELCAIRWRNLDLDNGILHVERSIGQIGGDVWEEETTKTHADRRIVLDTETVKLLTEHRTRCESRLHALGLELDPEMFVFSLDPDSRAPRRPESVSLRYRRMCRRLGIKTTIHKLRHYSATELILAGVDIRTVAGRLGHGGGGATTLRTYAAWVSEGDQRAAAHIATRMPKRATARPVVVDVDVKSPYQQIAVDLRSQILDGTLIQGLPIPTIKQLASTHDVSVPTAKRAVDLLASWGFVSVVPGQRTLVQSFSVGPEHDTAQESESDQQHVPPARAERNDSAPSLDLEVRHLGKAAGKLRTAADPEDSGTLHRLLVQAIKRSGGDVTEIGDYELIVRRAGTDDVVATYVAAAP